MLHLEETERAKILKQAYMIDFKELVVNRVAAGEAISQVVKEPGLSDQTLPNWIKASAIGKFKGTGNKVVTPQAMELSRF
ncbi:helix-turn-helix domain-containing protein [Glaciimonas sp. GNP009]